MRQTDRFTPDSVIDSEGCGVRASVSRAMKLVDPTEPAFHHVVARLQQAKKQGADLTTSAVEKAVRQGLHDYEVGMEVSQTRSIVYYVRRSTMVKIGTTLHPKRRFMELLPDEILAWEPGGLALEAERHAQFSSLRACPQQEYFELGQELVDHIAAVKGRYGAPDPTWPTFANVMAKRRTPKRARQPRTPTSSDLVSIPEGAKSLGLSQDTVYSWARRGKIEPVGTGRRGAALYYLTQIADLAREMGWEVD